MATFKFVLKATGEEKIFGDKKEAVTAASKLAYKNNLIIEVLEDKSGDWEVCATLYPSGEVRYPVNIGSFANGLPLRRKS